MKNLIKVGIALLAVFFLTNACTEKPEEVQE
jgi:hypothetical protein